MKQKPLAEGSLALYKGRPAQVLRVGKKFEIVLPDGETLKVRRKDLVLLHRGPMQGLHELVSLEGEVEAAWELLIGEAVSLSELAELIYGVDSPAAAWAAWQLVADGLYFQGAPDAVTAQSPDQVSQEKAARAARAEEKEAWSGFLERVQKKEVIPEDDRYLQEVEALALGQADKSRVLSELGRSERQETAHALLLELNRWGPTVDPYPARLRLSVTPPTAPMPGLPDEDRVDLTHLIAYAIDDLGNQDPDDALSLEGDRLWVHIADVAALVPPDSEADVEGRARGANIYLPEQTIPMLPPQATQILGMGLNEISPALSFGMAFDERADVLELEIVPSWVRVTRLTYEEAEAQIEDAPLRELYALAQRHEARRLDEGAVTMAFPETAIRVVDGAVAIRPLPPLRSRDVVREAMLMAGGAVARFAVERELPFPFSTQEPPAPGTVTQPDTMSEMFALRRMLRPRQMSSIPAPHAGLGMQLYAQVTSPLRRYLDLVAHQQLRACLRGQDPLGTQALLERIGAAEAVTGTISQLERLARRHWTLVYLMQHPEWEGEGVLVARFGSRGIVLIPDLDLECRIYVREEVPLDNIINLALNEVDLPELDVHFRITR
jgi:exoribonuclease-2